MKKNPFISLMIGAMMLTSCSSNTNLSILGSDHNHPNDDNSQIVLPEKDDHEEPKAEYSEGTLFLKTSHFNKTMLYGVDYISCEPIIAGGDWYTLKLKEHVVTKDAFILLDERNVFDDIEYNYLVDTCDVEQEEVNSSQHISDTLDTFGVKKLWEKMEHPGGSSDVVVAVIDTGVDYKHPDLKNNIWINVGEIDGNGIDDDNNGYIDDYYGWNFALDIPDPMDYEGHGTHVAGIIAAENNDQGVVGVAYNSKIMCLKVYDDKNGSLNHEAIIKAIQYAYSHGASVINLSLGGSGSSIMENVIDIASQQCIVVAAAGNSNMCNNPECGCTNPSKPTFPAAYKNVVGIMSCTSNGMYRSAFSNFDHYYYQSYDYNIYAPGEQIYSTMPNGKYAELSGTSMSSPFIAGIVALLRAQLPDRDMYPNKWIISQLVGTGKILNESESEYRVVDALSALEGIPSPELRMYDFKVFDGKHIDSNNNGDGIVDAGETIRLGLETYNITGLASEIEVSIELDEYFAERYDFVEILNNKINLPNIGTFSLGNGGSVYDEEGNLIDNINAFTIKIGSEAFHSCKPVFNVTYKYKNGLDEEDKKEYSYFQLYGAILTVCKAQTLPTRISGEYTLEKNGFYVIKEGGVTIENGATLIIEEGVEIVGLDYGSSSTPHLTNYGTLISKGTEENPVIMKADEEYLSDNYDKIYTSFTALLYGKNYIEYTHFYCYLYSSDTNGIKEVNYNGDGQGCYLDHCLVTGSALEAYNDLSIVDSRIDSIKIRGPVELERNNLGNILFPYFNSDGDSIINENLIGSIEIEDFLNTDLSITNNVFIGGIYLSDRSLKNREPADICDGNKAVNGSLSDKTKFYYNAKGELLFDFEKNEGQGDYSNVWPYIEEVYLTDENGVKSHIITTKNLNFNVQFSRPMMKEDTVTLHFGTNEAGRDYKVQDGEFVSDTLWKGSYLMKSFIESGINRISLFETSVRSADDPWKKHVEHYLEPYGKTFELDLTSAFSMNLFANATEDGVELTWLQDDYETLLGYNIYRCESKDGNFVRINQTTINPEENTYFDDNCEPGKLYWYTFTVVLTDLSESSPAGKISVVTMDTMAPNIYHTPINQWYLGNNLPINCIANDNVAIKEAKVFYRTIGSEEWKSKLMTPNSDKYTGIIYSSELSLAGLEYYIEVSDGRNIITRGSEDSPFKVIIKDATTISKLGDVDGDNVISAKDALLIIKCINGDVILTDDQFIRADLNKDKELTSSEALRILQFVNGKITSLEM